MSNETTSLVLTPECLGAAGFEGLGPGGLGRSVSRHRRSWFYACIALLVGLPIALGLLVLAREYGNGLLLLLALLAAGSTALLVTAERRRHLVLCEHGLCVVSLSGAERLVRWMDLTATLLVVHRAEFGPSQVGSLRLETRAGERIRLDTNWSRPNTVRAFILWLHRTMNPPAEAPVDRDSLGYRLGAWLREKRREDGRRPIS